jgi:hypothetical protein
MTHPPVHASLKRAPLLLCLWTLSCAPDAGSANRTQDLAVQPSGETGAQAAFSSSSPVDSVMVVLADLTGDEAPDTVRIHVQGESLLHPFRWSVEVRHGGGVLFRHEADDSSFDELFGDLGFAGNSGSREEDKLHYYFSRLPEMMVQPLQWDEESSPLRSRDYSGGPFEVVPRELREMGITDEARISAIVDGIVDRLRRGTLILVVPISPVQSEYPRIFVPEIQQFVDFYRW